MNFFNMPYMNQAVASDPTSSWQIRLKGKAYKAINDRLAYYADHVELSDGGCDFPTQLGIGGVVGSKFTWPKNNPNVKEDYLLTPEKERLYKHWVGLYNAKMLSTGDYLNLYDIAWDKPETHVIAKNGRMYYAFYADEWQGGAIELRGLDPGEALHGLRVHGRKARLLPARRSRSLHPARVRRELPDRSDSERTVNR